MSNNTKDLKSSLIENKMTTANSKSNKPDKKKGSYSKFTDDTQGTNKDPEVVGDGKPFIGDLDQAPLYLHENIDLIRGYRINYKTKMLATKSIFIIHNETVNVWSHLLGAIFFIYMIFYVIVYLPPSSMLHRSIAERWTSSFDVGSIDSEVCLAETPLNEIQCKSI